MKILFVNEYTLRRGGVDNVVDTEFNEVKKRNINVSLFSILHKDFINQKGHLNYLKILQAYYNSASNLQKEIDKLQPDIIHFHNLYPLLGSPIWNKINKGRTKIILHLHNYYPFCINSFLFRNGKICTLCIDTNSLRHGIINKCYDKSIVKSTTASFNKLSPQKWIEQTKKVDHFIGVSEFIRNKYIDFGIDPEKITIIHNFGEEINNVENIKGDYVLYIGDIVDAKGIEIICEAAKRLPHINFVIAGEGRDLKKYISSYRNSLNITFTGYVRGDEKCKIITNSRFLLLPFLSWESFGIVILESYNLGKPVVTSGRGGSSELVADGKTGIILPDLNLDMVCNKINEFWKFLESDNPYFYDCLEFSLKFSIDIHIQKLLDLYRKYTLD